MKNDIFSIFIADYKDKIRGFNFLMLTVSSIFTELFFYFENVKFLISKFQLTFRFPLSNNSSSTIFTSTYGLSIFFPIFIFIFITNSLHKDFEYGIFNLISVNEKKDNRYVAGKIISSFCLSITALLITWLVSFVVLNISYSYLSYHRFFLSFIRLIPITLFSCVMSILFFQLKFLHKIYGLILFIFIISSLKLVTYFSYHNFNFHYFLLNLLIILISVILIYICITRNTFNKDKILYEMKTLKTNKFINKCNIRFNNLKTFSIFKIKNRNHQFLTLLDMELRINIFRKNYKWYLGLIPILFLIILLPLKIVESYIIYLAILYLINEISHIGYIKSKFEPLKGLAFLPNMLNKKLLASYFCGVLLILFVGVPFIIRLLLASEYMAIYAYLSTAILLPSISIVLGKLTNNIKAIQTCFALVWTISLTHIGLFEYYNLSFCMSTILKYSLYILFSIIAVYIVYNTKNRSGSTIS